MDVSIDASFTVKLKQAVHPDNVAVMFILAFWLFILDVGVVVVDKSDIHATEYLTNQTWMLCLLAKVLLVIEFFSHLNREPDAECASLRGWCTTTLWLVVGSMQFGVLGAFFLLTYLDSTLLNDMLQNHEHTLAEIMIWNHARHVTVCFLHIAVTWSLRHYFSANAESCHECLCNSMTANYRLFCWILVVFPSLLGLIHWFIFDDQKLYKYGSKSIGSKCQGAFALCAFLSALYYIFVPLRSVELERKHPNTVVKAVWQSIPTEPEPLVPRLDCRSIPMPQSDVKILASLGTRQPSIPIKCVQCAAPVNSI